jgi:hypothetical protein
VDFSKSCCLQGEFNSLADHVVRRRTCSVVSVHDSNVALILIQWPLVRTAFSVCWKRILEDEDAIRWRCAGTHALIAVPQPAIWVVVVNWVYSIVLAFVLRKSECVRESNNRGFQIWPSSKKLTIPIQSSFRGSGLLNSTVILSPSRQTQLSRQSGRAVDSVGFPVIICAGVGPGVAGRAVGFGVGPGVAGRAVGFGVGPGVAGRDVGFGVGPGVAGRDVGAGVGRGVSGVVGLVLHSQTG